MEEEPLEEEGVAARPTGGGSGGDDDRDAAMIHGLSHWLEGVGLDRRASSLEVVGDGVLLAWRDGLPLVRLVEALEGRALSGIEWRPHASAQCKRNIEKALEVLRLKKGMPLTHLYGASKMVRGDAQTIFALLTDMRTAYKSKVGRTQPAASQVYAGPGPSSWWCSS